jgi:S1-C subfamily serine protease
MLFPRLAVATFIAIPVLCSPARADTDSTVAATFERIRPSLAIIYSKSDKQRAAGTGFCIYSDATHSDFLTNSHVLVGNDVIVEVSDGGMYIGRVLRRGAMPLDAAVVEITRGSIKALTLATALPRPGTQIAVAGFPSVHLSTDRKPSIHLGSVNSVIGDNGMYIEHDALTDHGNSGGPLFDQKTGIVYGINTFSIASRSDATIENYFAIAVPATFAFLGNAHVAYQTDTPSGTTVAISPPSTGILRDPPGAYRIGYAASPASQAGAQPIKIRVDAYISEQIRSFASASLFPVILSGSGSDAAQQLCKEQQLNALFLAIYEWSVKGGRHYASHAQFGVLDCFGDVVFKGTGVSEQTLSGNYADAYNAVAQAAADAALAQIREQISVDPTVAVNLIRYGIPLGTGQRSPGVVLGAGQSGAIVTSISPFGTAAKAGVQKLDVITSLNGHPLAGLQQVDLNTLISQIERAGGAYEAQILTADGSRTIVKYKSQDVRSYLNQLMQK